MKNNIEYGLVLGGGGTKGAYQVGVYKALCEMKINIKAITGTSIGALNGALFLQGDIRKMEDLYLNIDIKDVFKDDFEIDTDKNIFDIKNIFSLMMEYFKQRGLDNSALKETMLKYVDMDKVYKSKTDLGIVAYSVKGKEGIESFKNNIQKDEMIDYLMASACFPIFKAQKIKGNEYFDGGLSDVIPINMLLKRGYKNIIAVDVEGPGIARNTINKEAKIKLIHCDEDLGGVFEFNKDKIERNIKLGYLDTMRSFNRLQGHIYYFRPKEFDKLLKQFNVRIISGLEIAARLYNIDICNEYTAKGFLDVLMQKHEDALRKYESIKETLDLKQNTKINKSLPELVDSGLGVCFLMDILSTQPTFAANKILQKSFQEFLDAAEAMSELL